MSVLRLVTCSAQQIVVPNQDPHKGPRDCNLFIYLFLPANTLDRRALSGMGEIVNVSLSDKVKENTSIFMNLVLFIFLAKINILISANPRSSK